MGRHVKQALGIVREEQLIVHDVLLDVLRHLLLRVQGQTFRHQRSCVAGSPLGNQRNRTNGRALVLAESLDVLLGVVQNRCYLSWQDARCALVLVESLDVRIGTDRTRCSA